MIYSQAKWYQPFVDIIATIVEVAADRTPDPTAPTSPLRPAIAVTVGDVRLDMERVIMAAGRGRWSRVNIDSNAWRATTEIAAKCRRCGSASVVEVPDERARSGTAAIDALIEAVDRLGCYCVARDGEV